MLYSTVGLVLPTCTYYICRRFICPVRSGGIHSVRSHLPPISDSLVQKTIVFVFFWPNEEILTNEMDTININEWWLIMNNVLRNGDYKEFEYTIVPWIIDSKILIITFLLWHVLTTCFVSCSYSEQIIW